MLVHTNGGEGEAQQLSKPVSYENRCENLCSFATRTREEQRIQFYRFGMDKALKRAWRNLAAVV
jgi:hypothetical protein